MTSDVNIWNPATRPRGSRNADAMQCKSIGQHESARVKILPLTSGVMGLLTGPHHTSFSEVSSLTIRLSVGDRPVFAPEYAERAPDDMTADPVS